MSDTLAVTEQSLELAIAALRRDYSKLASRIRVLNKTIKCHYDSVKLRLHYPSFRQGSATIPELVDAIARYLTPFCLPRSETDAVDKLYRTIDVEEFKARFSRIQVPTGSFCISCQRER